LKEKLEWILKTQTSEIELVYEFEYKDIS